MRLVGEGFYDGCLGYAPGRDKGTEQIDQHTEDESYQENDGIEHGSVDVALHHSPAPHAEEPRGKEGHDQITQKQSESPSYQTDQHILCQHLADYIGSDGSERASYAQFGQTATHTAKGHTRKIDGRDAQKHCQEENEATAILQRFGIVTVKFAVHRRELIGRLAGKTDIELLLHTIALGSQGPDFFLDGIEVLRAFGQTDYIESGE